VFGSRLEADRWFIEPAMGLNIQKPIDLVSTSEGRELVANFLGQLEYGVYV
jgi:putative toxin-antitoxin system antitoxin component (TIGR02293 family)